MLDIKKQQDNKTLTVSLIGDLDTITSPNLEASLSESLEGIEHLVFDFSELNYISSAGLRVILATQENMNKQGKKMVIRNISDEIKKIFEVVGFIKFINIE